MPIRQQLLYLWLAEGSLETPVVAWAWHDGCDGQGPEAPSGDPPYAKGVDALRDGWCLIQSPPSYPLARGAEHEIGALPYEFLFERRIELAG